MTGGLRRGIVAGLILLLAAGTGAFAQEQRAGTGQSGAEPGAFENALRDRLVTQANRTEDQFNSAISRAMLAFYEERAFAPMWFGSDAARQKALALLDRLSRAPEHGLRSENYDIPGLRADYLAAGSERNAGLELRLTRAMLVYGADVRYGRIRNPRRLGGLFHEPWDIDHRDVLNRAAAAADFPAFLDRLPTQARRYEQLLGGLARYREIAAAGGWQPIDDGETLRPAMESPRVAQLRRRLAATGDLRRNTGDAEVYDFWVSLAVQRFQDRHGLVVDGLVGPNTLAALNVPVEDRIRQIIINLERRRWTAERLGDYYIFVNIADNYMKLVQNDETIHVARVVVGQPYHKTPIFSRQMEYIRFNPYWNVPRSIAVNEMLPRIKDDPGYLESRHYLLLTQAGNNDTAVNPQSVDWSQVTPSNFSYYIRQRPGPWNALGTMIFMFPNRFNVFLHDTSARGAFERNNRFFSHGCVRVQYPHRLAMLVLRYNEGWSEERLRQVLERDEPVIIRLGRPIDVHITYLTAWTLRNGEVHFRGDAYDRDGELIEAMRAAQDGLRLDAAAEAR